MLISRSRSRIDPGTQFVEFLPEHCSGHRRATPPLLLEIELQRAGFTQAFIEHPERMRQVADQFDFRVIVCIDLGRQEIGVNDSLGAA